MNTVEDRLRAALHAKSDGLTPLDPPLPAADSDDVVRLLPVPAGRPPRRLATTAAAALVAAAVAITVGITVARTTGSTSVAPVRSRSEIPWSQVGDGWTLVQTNPPSVHNPKGKVDQLDLIDPAGIRYLAADLTGKQWELSSWSQDTGRALLRDDAGPDAGYRSSVVQLDLHTGQHQEFTVAGNHDTMQYADPGRSHIIFASGADQVVIAGSDGQHQVQLPPELPGAGQLGRLNPIFLPELGLMVLGTDRGVAAFRLDGSLVRTIAAPAGYSSCTTTSQWSNSAVAATCGGKGKYGAVSTVVFSVGADPSARSLAAATPTAWQFWNLPSGTVAFRQGSGFNGDFAQVAADGHLTPIPVPAVLKGMQWQVHSAGGSRFSIQFWNRSYAQEGLLSFDPFTRKATTLYSLELAGDSLILAAPWNFLPDLSP